MVALCQTAATSTEKPGWGGRLAEPRGSVVASNGKEAIDHRFLTDPSVIWGKQPFKAAFKIMTSLAARRGVPKTPRERCAKGGVYSIPIRVPFLKGHLSHQGRPQGRARCEPISNCRPSVLKSRTQPLMVNI